jgi:hypothetical protein
MNQMKRFSAIPVGETFKYKGELYVRYTYNRGKQTVGKRVSLTHFPDHRIVEWVNAYPNQLEG